MNVEERPGQPQPQGVVASAVRVAGDVLTVLPPAFVALLIVNVIFIGVVMWFLNDQMAVRNAFVGKLLDSCLAQLK